MSREGGTTGMEQLSYSARFTRPFVRLLSAYSGLKPGALDRAKALTGDDRVTVEDAHAALGSWVKQTGDVDIGLKAGRLLSTGWGGVLDYAMQSAPSLREGTKVATRYVRLFSDCLQPKLEV